MQEKSSIPKSAKIYTKMRSNRLKLDMSDVLCVILLIIYLREFHYLDSLTILSSLSALKAIKDDEFSSSSVWVLMIT